MTTFDLDIHLSSYHWHCVCLWVEMPWQKCVSGRTDKLTTWKCIMPLPPVDAGIKSWQR